MIVRALVAELMVVFGSAIVLTRHVIPTMDAVGPALGGFMLICWLIATICAVTMAHLTLAD